MFMHSLIHSLLYSAIIYGDPTMCQALEVKWRMRQTCCQETDILIEEGEQEKNVNIYMTFSSQMLTFCGQNKNSNSI